jgi:hypothetical protein
VLPFQVIEQVDEPRAEKSEDSSLQGLLFDERGRQLKGWTNKLIWGDNKLVLSSLKDGPLREEIEKQGGLKLIYIDPPFNVGADFSMDIEIGSDTFKLVCLSNLENLNALFIREGMPQAARLVKLNQIAIQQMRLLIDDSGIKQLGNKGR